MIARLLAVATVGTGMLVLVIVLGICFGSWHLTPAELWQALTGSGPESHQAVVWQLRFPRVLLAAAVGASLSLAGVALQSLLRNPLADPYIVGTSAGAALGAASAMSLGAGALLAPLCGFAGALASVAAVFALSRRGPVLVVETFLLAGVVVSAFLGSMVSLVLTFSRQELARIVFWLMGNLGSADWAAVQVLVPYLLVGAAGLWTSSLSLNLFTLGEEPAHFLGVEIERAKRLVIALAALLTAGAVAAAGMVGFVGLVVPHAARRLVGPDHRVLLPAAAFGGASYLVVCDLVARLIVPGGEIPVGILTALAGAPFFLYLLRRAGR